MDIPYEAEAFARSLHAGGRSPFTIKTYQKAVTAFSDWLVTRGETLADVAPTRQMVEDFLGYERDRGLSAQTIHQHHSSLTQFFKYASRENDEPNPMSNIAAPAVPLNPPPVLTVDQLQALFEACRGQGFDERRDLALISLMADTGIRRSEVAGIRLDDMDLREQVITVRGKTGTRGVPYGSTTGERLDRYLRLRRKHRHSALPNLWLGSKGALTVFGVEGIIQKRGQQAGVRVHPHIFRHSFAHMWLDGGGNEIDLQRLAGWKSPAMLQRYGASAASARARRAYLAGRSPVDRISRRDGPSS